MLEHVKVDTIRLLTNNPRKIDALEAMGVHVSDIVPLLIETNPHNEDYLAVKVKKMGHIK
jgi:GTP cyclohydrolase II